MGSERKPVRASIAARRRGQGRLRAVTVAIGAASVLTGGGIAFGLPGAASAATHAGSTSGSAATSGTSPGTSSSGGLKSSAAPTFVSGSSQVTSGGS